MTVIVESGDGLRQEITVRGKTVIADEPTELGGADEGPNPYELLLGALGACTAMTLLMYARRKKWSLARVRVELDHSRVHAKDCEECEDKPVMLDYFRKRITVTGELTEEQRVHLEEIAQRCPVHRTLTGTIRIEDQLEVERPSA
jgi:uncharacterized OsmC-like protein